MRTPSNQAAVGHCYTSTLRTPAWNEHGFVVVRFAISEQGEVLWSDVHDRAPTISERTARCVANAVMSFHFADIFNNVAQIIYFQFQFEADFDPFPVKPAG
jgi:hypothetical protein